MNTRSYQLKEGCLHSKIEVLHEKKYFNRFNNQTIERGFYIQFMIVERVEVEKGLYTEASRMFDPNSFKVLLKRGNFNKAKFERLCLFLQNNKEELHKLHLENKKTELLDKCVQIEL